MRVDVAKNYVTNDELVAHIKGEEVTVKADVEGGSSLAEALVAAGRVEDARATLENAIKRVESQMGEGHPIVRQLQGQLEMLPSDG